jgi:hypothetical protein
MHTLFSCNNNNFEIFFRLLEYILVIYESNWTSCYIYIYNAFDNNNNLLRVLHESVAC